MARNAFAADADALAPVVCENPAACGSPEMGVSTLTEDACPDESEASLTTRHDQFRTG
jgi:hypothetical protein